jgi:hypothetical protein
VSSDLEARWEYALGKPGEIPTIERPEIPTLGWYRPDRIWAENGWLRWSTTGDPPFHHTRVEPTLLSRFAKLAGRSDDAIVGFASRWGVLGICGHVNPKDRDRLWEGDWEQQVRLAHLHDCGEPIALWHRISRHAQAILNISAALRRGRLGATDDWQALGESFFPNGRWWHTTSIEGEAEEPRGLPRDQDLQGSHLGAALNTWLRATGVRPRVVWSPGQSRVYHNEPGLLAAVGTQLLAASTAARGMAVCCECGDYYEPERKPRADQANYCRPCRKAGAANRNNARKYRREASRKARQEQDHPAGRR